jgi:hypothetical protein
VIGVTGDTLLSVPQIKFEMAFQTVERDRQETTRQGDTRYLSQEMILICFI